MKLAAMGIVIVAACGGKSEPKGVETPLGTTGAKIDLPKGWRITDQGKHHERFNWEIEFGDMSSNEWRVLWCRTMEPLESIEKLVAADDSCRHEKNTVTKTLPSGAFFVECDKNEAGTDLHHIGASVATSEIDTGSMIKHAAVHCFANTSSPTDDHYAIIKSLRTK